MKVFHISCKITTLRGIDRQDFNMKNRLRSKIYWIGVLGGFFIFLYQVISGIEFLKGVVLSVEMLGYLGLGLIFTTLSNGARYSGWQQLMKSFGVRLPWTRFVAGYSLSFLPRLMPGSIWGYVSRSEWLYQVAHIPYRITVFTSSIELALAITSALMLIGLNLARGGGNSAIIIAIPFLVLGTWFIAHKLLGIRLEQYLSNGAGWVRENVSNHWTHFISAGGLITISWVLSSLGLIFLTRAFNISNPMHLMDAMMSFCIAWLIGLLILFVPTGLGVREFTLARILVGNYGLMLPLANAISVIFRIILLSGELIWLALSVLVDRRIKV